MTLAPRSIHFLVGMRLYIADLNKWHRNHGIGDERKEYETLSFYGKVIGN
jgi:hypothetical protein